MNIKKRYLITGGIIVAALLVLLSLSVFKQKSGAIFPLTLQKEIPAKPHIPTGVMPTDLSRFNEQVMHDLRLLKANNHTYVGIVMQHDTTNTIPALTTWVVQLGSFHEKTNAVQLSQKLEMQHFPAFVMMKSVDDMSRWVVFVGPSLEKKTADNWRHTIEESMAIDGLVLPYQLRTHHDLTMLTKEDQSHVQ